MTIYEKLNEARVRFQESGIKPSGENTYAKYTYYELGDIMPVINELAKELGFSCIVSFGDIATLEVVNSTMPEERIKFTSPMSTANLKGCHDVQNLGAVETYIKRYLYQNAFEIVESDGIDGIHDTDGKISPPANSKQPPKVPNHQEPPKNENQSSLEERRDKIVKEIKALSKEQYPDGTPYFSDEDLASVKKIVDRTGAYERGIKILEEQRNKLKDLLEQRKPASSFDGTEFADDIPF
jgi:hypothetical protein